MRQQAADLISRIAVVMKNCGEEALLNHLGLVLYEYLGEEYPEVCVGCRSLSLSVCTVVVVCVM